MNKIFLFAVLFALATTAHTSSYAQIRKIPAEVTDRFSEKYPDATGVEWKDKLTGFTAVFILGDTSYRASFDNDGEWEGTAQEIETEALPDEVQDSFRKSKYAEWEMIRAHKIELPDDQWRYRVEVGKGDIKKRNLLFTPKGRLLKDNLTL